MADISTKVNDFKSLGNTWTGKQTFSSVPDITPVISTDAASGSAVNKAYVDSRDSNYLPLSGGTLTGGVNTRSIFGNNKDYWKYIGIGYTGDINERNKHGGYIVCARNELAPDTDLVYNKVEICPGGNGLDNRFIVQNRDNEDGEPTFQILTKTQSTTASEPVYQNLVRSVNGKNAEEDGNVTLDVGVTKVNNIPPKDGNVTLDVGVTKVNNISPKDGNVTLNSETWTFGLADGTTVTKNVVLK